MAFAKENAGIYRVPYSKLYNFVEAFLRINLLDIGSSSKSSFHAMATESAWSSSLRQCVSQIRSKRWFPLRHKIISLGLHLNMDDEDINRMLLLAQMEPLYVKNPIEAAVKFAIREARLSTPEGTIIPDGSNGLCLFVKDILQQLDLAEGEYLIGDLKIERRRKETWIHNDILRSLTVRSWLFWRQGRFGSVHWI